MIKYAKVINQETGLCEVGTGTNVEFYKSIGFTQLDVEQSDVDNDWYLATKCPHKSDEQKLQEAKLAKYEENDKKAEVARYSKEFYVTINNQECLFDTKAQTQTDLLTAFSVCSSSEGATYDGWVTNNNITVNLTLADVVTISTKFKEKSNVYPHWSYYQTLIEQAATLAEVQAIEINYEINIGE